MTFVSVIIPAHEMNSIFESVLLHLQPTIQTYSDYEVIVVSDNCPQVVQYVETNYPAYKIANTHYEGHGISQARNLGTTLANPESDLYLWLDSDCLPPADHIEKFASAYIPNCLFVGAIYYMDDDMQTILRPEIRNIYHLPRPERFERIYDITHWYQYWTGNAGVCAKSFHQFNEELVGGEDTYFALTHLETHNQLKYVFSAVRHKGLTDTMKTEQPNYQQQYDKSKYHSLVEKFFQNRPDLKIICDGAEKKGVGCLIGW
tara:strand:+ start:2279 stop:3058 length:780 start_codon:yes stop_codon:yes gene_type:complete